MKTKIVPMEIEKHTLLKSKIRPPVATLTRSSPLDNGYPETYAAGISVKNAMGSRLEGTYLLYTYQGSKGTYQWYIYISVIIRHLSIVYISRILHHISIAFTCNRYVPYGGCYVYTITFQPA